MKASDPETRGNPFPRHKVMKASPACPYPDIDPLECKGCGRCIADCPKQVLAWGGTFNERGYRYAVYAGEGCIGCRSCYYTCPEPGAIELHLLPACAKRERTGRCQPV